jgi:hypothetical protein
MPKSRVPEKLERSGGWEAGEVGGGGGRAGKGPTEEVLDELVLVGGRRLLVEVERDARVALGLALVHKERQGVRLGELARDLEVLERPLRTDARHAHTAR